MAAERMTPVLKWAGGKTQLLEPIAANMPAEYNRYYEPFLGGAAVLFSIAPAQAFVSDINEQLINLYTQLKTAADSVIAKVNDLDSVPCTKDFYYAARKQYNERIASRSLDAECAAFMIWLNKHCFNGLYRVNSKGLFNVPYNNKVNGRSIDERNIRSISAYLQSADITLSCVDFEQACENVSAGDFVYFDSP
ncbi:Dam family site-specific DNA-(adenine-N6)-methyltransferase, partial [bacterium]|nr:Dam family site-specific DNA-(adenine-N6)-methyltransferase [bacterium]